MREVDANRIGEDNMARKAAIIMAKRQIEEGVENLITTLTTHDYQVEINELCNAGPNDFTLSFLLTKKDSLLLSR